MTKLGYKLSLMAIQPHMPHVRALYNLGYNRTHVRLIFTCVWHLWLLRKIASMNYNRRGLSCWRVAPQGWLEQHMSSVPRPSHRI
jgi:hypothetical protein